MCPPVGEFTAAFNHLNGSGGMRQAATQEQEGSCEQLTSPELLRLITVTSFPYSFISFFQDRTYLKLL